MLGVVAVAHTKEPAVLVVLAVVAQGKPITLVQRVMELLTQAAVAVEHLTELQLDQVALAS